MTDFAQHGVITTLHDLETVATEHLETLLEESTGDNKLGLVLPVTASDMRAAPFARIIDALVDCRYIDQIVVVLGVAPEVDDYRATRTIVDRLGSRGRVLWTDGARCQQMYETLTEAGFLLNVPGKGRSVWTAFGYLLADPRIKAFVLHDCDIVNYDRAMLARLCLPMAHPSLDFEFCKAYYARCTDRMHGRVVRLLVAPLLEALAATLGPDPFVDFLSGFRYPLAGEFAVTSTLARSNRIPSDWGLEVGTLAEVFRNTSIKRVCQVDICRQYEHKHQSLSLDDTSKGLMKMATDILTTLLRTLASRGRVFHPGHFVTLRSSYLRHAQDAIRKYHADALINGLAFDRHAEEHAVEGFARQIRVAGDAFQEDPSGGEAISNWARVVAALPDFPRRLRDVASADAQQWS
ncbi:MAG: glycosyl transferase [Pirellulales bacterium]